MGCQDSKHRCPAAAPEGSERGQVMVETALTLPLMVFFILGTIQLGMMHQAKLMTEYAAYRAARVGIVQNGDCQKMRTAALQALTPTLPPLPGVPSRSDSLTRAVTLYHAHGLTPVYLNSGITKLRVQVLNPSLSAIPGLFNSYGAHLNKQEIDFDDIRNDAVREANLLSIKLTYNYEMRIPFANWLIHSWFMAGTLLKGSRGIQFESQQVAGQPFFTAAQASGATRGGDMPAIAAAAKGLRRFYIPLVSTHTMRMQSNLFAAVKGCAIDP